MKNLLIKQAIFLPIVYFGTLLLAGLFAVDYSHVGQHASELAINKSKTAGLIFNIGACLTGILTMLFAVGLIARFKKQLLITSFLIMLFGITFVSGGLIPIGSPWHGIYGIGFLIVVLPFAYMLEMDKRDISSLIKCISVLTTLVLLVYFWLILANFYPVEHRGLVQRVFGVAIFGWLSYIAYDLHKSSIK